MARPLKEGMDYFPHDVDASTDEKIIAMRAVHGHAGYAVYFTLLERVYRTTNGKLDISRPSIKATVASILRVSIEEFDSIMNTALDVGLFDSASYAKGIITSHGIRMRIKKVETEREKGRARRAGYSARVITRDNPTDNSTDNETDNRVITQQETGREIPQGKERKKERKRKYKDNVYAAPVDVLDLFEYYLALDLPKHKAVTASMTMAIEKARKDNGYTLDDCKELLRRHSRVVELTRNKEHPVIARGFDVFFGQKAYQATHLICSEYAEGGKYFEMYRKQLEPDKGPTEFHMTAVEAPYAE